MRCAFDRPHNRQETWPRNQNNRTKHGEIFLGGVEKVHGYPRLAQFSIFFPWATRILARHNKPRKLLQCPRGSLKTLPGVGRKTSRAERRFRLRLRRLFRPARWICYTSTTGLRQQSRNGGVLGGRLRPRLAKFCKLWVWKPQELYAALPLKRHLLFGRRVLNVSKQHFQRLPARLGLLSKRASTRLERACQAY